MKYSKNTKPLSLDITHGKGAIVWTKNGDRFIDASAQTFNLIFGHGCKLIDDAVKEQIDKLSYCSSRFSFDTHEVAIEIIGNLCDHRFSNVSFKINSGSMAIEHALKVAKKVSGKNLVVALTGSYHGQSLETARISGRRPYQNYLEPRNVVFTDTPNCERPFNNELLNPYHIGSLDQLVDYLEREGADNVAAFVVEPILVEAGMIILPDEYLKRVRKICHKYKITLIYDEVQTAGGWLDNYFFFQKNSSRADPDIVALGKAISGGYPLAAVLLGNDYNILEYSEHEFTYGGTPIGLAAFIAAAKFTLSAEFERAKKRILIALESRIERLRELEGIRHARGAGLMWSVGLKCSKLDRHSLQKLLLEHGVIARTTISEDSVLSIQLKINVSMTDDEISQLFDVIEKISDISN